MRNYVLTGAFVTLCAGAFASAQTPQQQTPTPQPPAQSEAGEQVKLVGCLYHERDVPGRQPNVAEQAGVMEDYILVDAQPATEAGATGTSGTAGTTGAASASGKMYKVENIDDERLSDLVGKKVEVTGRIDKEAGDTDRPTGTSGTDPQKDRSIGPDQIELPEFEAASIREVPGGECPATPEKR